MQLILRTITLVLLLTPSLRADLTIAFTVSVPNPSSHFFHVTMELDGLDRSINGGKYIDLRMPVWTPGSYIRENAARNVLFFSADASGQALRHEKTEPSCWRVWTEGKRTVRIAYQVFANGDESEPYEARVDWRYAYFNGAVLFLYPDGKLDRPSTVRLIQPAGWQHAVSLPSEGAGETYRAEDFDALFDCTARFGHLASSQFNLTDRTGRTATVRVVMDKENAYPQQSLDELHRLCQTTVDLFGEVPFSEYTFFFNIVPGGRGGIEHAYSTVIGTPKGAYERTVRAYFLSVSAHEFYHAWNVKRLRPEGLGPFDYQRETYVKTLYVAEGISAYYPWLILQRSGLYGEGDFYRKIAEMITWCNGNHGNEYKSLEDYSIDSWNRSDFPYVSYRTYYRRGALTAMCLDLEIRHRSKNRLSLDDVMLSLYSNYYKKRRGYPSDALQRACEALTQTSFTGFFDDYVRGTVRLDYNRFLRHAGLETRPLLAEPRPYLGVETESAGGWPKVTFVIPGSPAFECGLSYDDRIIAVDGLGVEAGSLMDMIGRYLPGDTVHISVLRSDRLVTLPVRLTSRTPPEVSVRELPDASDEQVELRRRWMEKQP